MKRCHAIGVVILPCMAAAFTYMPHALKAADLTASPAVAAKTVTDLDDLKSHAPWQAAAIGRILPYMREIAEDTTKANTSTTISRD
jgi:hypothetical protein